MTTAGKSSVRITAWIVQTLRLLMLAAIVFLLRWQHGHYLAEERRLQQALLPLETVQRYFPQAVKTAASSIREDAQDAFSQEGECFGRLLQTSPQADHILGFSGPTNVLLVCDSQDKLITLEILSSRDTRDHVAKIQQQKTFLQSYNGLTLQQAAQHTQFDAVSGATLTCYAISESIRQRLGKSGESLKFANQPQLADIQLLFPTAKSFTVDTGSPSQIRIHAANEIPLGWILRTSPVSDNITGYQGPTDTLIGFDTSGKVIGVALHKSYDNEPYVGYVRDDTYLRELFNQQLLPELAQQEAQLKSYEGASGATMTSMAVVKGIVAAAKNRVTLDSQQTEKQSWITLSLLDWLAISTIFLGIFVSFSRWRGVAAARILWQCLVICLLGFTSGVVLSQALFFGWSQTGLPRNAPVFVLLLFAAFSLPLFTKRNVYCSHLCPHGAVQQLTLRFARPQWQPSSWLKQWLGYVPSALLVACLIIALGHLPISLVDLEPFDAYLLSIAGWATTAIAIAGIVASCFVPMAYCRYGCPTGALLEYVRTHARSHLWTLRDWFALTCLLAAALWCVYDAYF